MGRMGRMRAGGVGRNSGGDGGRTPHLNPLPQGARRRREHDRPDLRIGVNHACGGQARLCYMTCNRSSIFHLTSISCCDMVAALWSFFDKKGLESRGGRWLQAGRPRHHSASTATLRRVRQAHGRQAQGKPFDVAQGRQGSPPHMLFCKTKPIAAYDSGVSSDSAFWSVVEFGLAWGTRC